MSPPSDKPVMPGEAEPLAVVETPTSPSSGLALSRFEFETGKGNEGTKILMVEWDGSAGQVPSGGDNDGEGGRKTESSSSIARDWDISWEGKPAAVLHVRDTDTTASSSISSGDSHRVYFLLPPGATVPALVTISRKARDGKGNGVPGLSVLRTKPMPAIFPAQLGGADKAGRRGVLHTIWARKRLAELEAEIAAEMKENIESVGLEMAAQERLWIVDHFGLAPENGQGAPAPAALLIPQTPISPTSPRSPIGGKLGEKLRGLKLATSPSELAAATQAAKTTPAVPGPILPSLTRPFPKGAGNGGVASLDAIVGNQFPPVRGPGGDDNTEEDLFALPMSPRSPEMKRSPFSLL